MNAFSDSQGKDAAHMLAANTNDEEYSNFSNENISESVTTEDTTMEETAETGKIVVKNSHFWGLFFTIVGVILVDFCSDAAQSPSRTYMLDVTTTGSKININY